MFFKVKRRFQRILNEVKKNVVFIIQLFFYEGKNLILPHGLTDHFIRYSWSLTDI